MGLRLRCDCSQNCFLACCSTCLNPVSCHTPADVALCARGAVLLEEVLWMYAKTRSSMTTHLIE